MTLKSILPLNTQGSRSEKWRPATRNTAYQRSRLDLLQWLGPAKTSRPFHFRLLPSGLVLTRNIILWLEVLMQGSAEFLGQRPTVACFFVACLYRDRRITG